MRMILWLFQKKWYIDCLTHQYYIGNQVRSDKGSFPPHFHHFFIRISGWVAHHFVQITNGCRHFIISLFSFFRLWFRRMTIHIYYRCHLYCLKPVYYGLYISCQSRSRQFRLTQKQSRAASFPFHLYKNTLKSIPHTSLIERPEGGLLRSISSPMQWFFKYLAKSSTPMPASRLM